MNNALCVNQMSFLFSQAKLARKMLTVGKRSRVAPGWLPSDYQLKNSSGKYKSRSLVAKTLLTDIDHFHQSLDKYKKHCQRHYGPRR